MTGGRQGRSSAIGSGAACGNPPATRILIRAVLGGSAGTRQTGSDISLASRSRSRVSSCCWLCRRSHGSTPSRHFAASPKKRSPTLSRAWPRLLLNSSPARVGCKRLRRFRPARPYRRDRFRQTAERLSERAHLRSSRHVRAPPTIRPTPRCPGSPNVYQKRPDRSCQPPLAQSRRQLWLEQRSAARTFRVDPKEEIVAVMMCQTSIGPMRTSEFENAVMQAIIS